MEKQYKKYHIELLIENGQVPGVCSPSHLSVFVFAHSKEDALERARSAYYDTINGGSIGGPCKVVVITLTSKDPHIEHAILTINLELLELVSCSSHAMGKLKGKKELIEKLKVCECQEAMDAISGKEG
jgi:hypothetical protein